VPPILSGGRNPFGYSPAFPVLIGKQPNEGLRNPKNSMSNACNELTTFEFKALARLLIQSPDCPPIALWGDIGVGKSAIVRQVIEEVSDPAIRWEPRDPLKENGILQVINNWGLIDLRVSLLEPTDLMGLPDPRGAIVQWAAPSVLPVKGQEHRFPKRGALFLDEFTHAQIAMQNACYSLILDRRCGPHELLPDWIIIAASNCNHENAHTFPMSAPLRNRFAHFHIRCSLDAFKRWALRVPFVTLRSAGGPTFGARVTG
jgi:hypothetical protein